MQSVSDNGATAPISALTYAFSIGLNRGSPADDFEPIFSHHAKLKSINTTSSEGRLPALLALSSTPVSEESTKTRLSRASGLKTNQHQVARGDLDLVVRFTFANKDSSARRRHRVEDDFDDLAVQLGQETVRSQR